MHFTTKKSQALSKHKSPCLVLGLHEGKKSTEIFATDTKAFDKVTKDHLMKLYRSGDFTGSNGQTLLLYQVPGLAAERVLLLGLGKAGSLSVKDFKKSVTQAAKAATSIKAKEVHFALESLAVTHDGNTSLEAQNLQQAMLAIHSVTYQFNDFKSKSEKPEITRWCWLLSNPKRKDISATLQETLATCHGMSVTQDLGNSPGNVCHPTYMANYAKKLAASSSKLTCKVLNEADLKKKKMGAYLAVSKGSEQPPKLICLEYKGGKAGDKPIVLVGKGITFDTGGISLKGSNIMMGMKFDMCGAATVMGVMRAVSEMKLPLNVVGVMACAENMPSHKATRPDDIVTSMAGITVEISNTDAEGRLVLCDALTYSQQQYKPKALIDMATLTGACVVALGNHATAVYSNQQSLATALVTAGEETYDRAWQMPLWDEYQPQLDSKIADVCNIGSPGGGSITAACFLSRFTKDCNWAHLDIAGTAAVPMGKDGLATGRPVPLIVQYLVNESKR